MSPTLHSSMLVLGAVLALGGCAVTPTAPSVLVLPGTQKSPAQFQADNLVCQQHAQAMLAPDAQNANNQAVASAAIGTAVGAAAGALLGGGGYYSNNSTGAGAATGLMFGSMVGVGQSQSASYSLQQRYDIAYMQCMYANGHQIPGQASYRRHAPAAPSPDRPPPVYSPPNYPPPNTPPPVGPTPPA